MPITPEKNAVGWFEVPVADMERAIAFYETVFDIKLERHQMGALDMAWFPWVDKGDGAGGSLVRHEAYTPSSQGALLYFTAWSGDCANELARVEAAGGKVLQLKKEISSEYGFMGVALDTEGNRIAIHSRS